MKNFTSILTILFISSIAWNQTTEKTFQTGTYGSYPDISTFTEIKINPDSTFHYYDQFELSGNMKFDGVWIIKGKKLILLDQNKQLAKTIPAKWKIKGNTLVSNKTDKSMTRIKRRLILTLKSK